MSIKDLFSKSKVAIYESAESASADLESADFLKKKVEENNTFIPFTDFSDPSQFIKFGSAELYYDNSIKRVYQQYPYDGSGKEKLEFQLSSSYLDRWLYENKYPKSTGYAILTAGGYGVSTITDGYGLSADHEYIYAAGGLHTSSAGLKTGELFKNFDSSIIYDASKNRTQNFRVNPVDGTTVEFWLKKDQFIPSSTEKEVVLDLWNGAASSSVDYGRLTIYLSASTDGLNTVRATLQNGTTGFADESLAASSFTTASVADGNWHHYAVSFLSQSSGIKTFFYVDGDLNNERTIGSAGINELSGRINAYVGALQASPSGSAAAQYAGKLSGSIDEFRFWKARRTSKQINLNWYRPVDGGANTEDNNTSLGCYFKFNEGITGTSLDSTVLDYSGRLTNGSWTGYASGARSTDSCFVSAGVLSAEPADPIIYSNHPSVVSLQNEMQTSGSEYDEVNSTLLYNKLPQFMRDEDEENQFDIKKLYQIISSYFDTIYAQTKVLPDISNKNYLSSSTKPLPFANRLLESRGFQTSELFVDTEILEFYGDNDYENKKYEDNVADIKNLIYHNIYNNLDYIYKTKGSEKSFRNLLRCFGIDDELVKFNVYTDGGIHYFNDNFKDTSVTAKYINHNKPLYFGASVYQTSSANNSLSYISGSGAEKLEKYNAFTFEVDTIIPEKLPATDPAFFDTGFLSASIGGFHQANTTDYDWAAGEIANAQIYLVRDEIESNRAKFLLTNQDGTLVLSSSYYSEIYDNERWILAVRVKPTAYPIVGSMLTSSSPTYEISFYGVNHEFGEVQNEFTVTASLNYASGSSYLSEPKRLYVGAHRQNFTGSVLQETDVQVGSCRFWMDYLSNTDLKGHSKDITNLGVDNSTRNSTIFGNGLTNVPIPRSDTLALNWDFDLVTSSSAGGTFNVVDVSSGSTDTIYGWIDNIIRREHEATSIGFGASKTSFVDKELVYASKKELPEISVTSDSIFIKNDFQKFFIKDDDVSDNFYSLEKSMYQIISEEMLAMFASAVEFNNLIGQAVDRYRHRYKHLDKMRQLFFQKIQSDMDFDRFTEYYKWIDSAISEMMVQLYPASVRHSDSIANMVESHILERNKYQNKFPITERLSSTEGSARGVGELNYNWKFGHAPVGGAENENCLWNKERKERTDIPDRETIRQVVNNRNAAIAPKLFKTDGTSYEGSTFAINRLSKPYRESIGFDNSIHGGINYSEGKDRDFVYSATQIHGPVSRQYPKGIPQNVMVVGVGEGQGTDAFIDCVDVEDPNEKRKWRFSAVLGRFAQTTGSSGSISARTGMDYQYKVKSSLYWPSNVVSGTVTSGYNKQVVEKFKSGSIITNLHSDTFSPTNDIGIQGPFTEAWVGGHQSRHVDLNKYDATKTTTNKLDDQYTREEAWRLLLRECRDSDPNKGAGDGAMGFVGPDYGGPYPDYTRKYAIRYRDERTKRPLNIKNIRTTTGSAVHGNFAENYEVIHTFGRKQNSKGFVKSEGVQLSPFFDGLPATTQEASLVGVRPRSAGNLVMSFYNSNRIAVAIRDQQAVDANTFGKTVIATRFSAPGGFETMSEVFLDVASKEYSAYNAMPFRNLSVRGSGSGESGTIRVNSHANRREGLRTLLARHTGRFGIDSQHGSVVSENYNAEASFSKINRNTRKQLVPFLSVAASHPANSAGSFRIRGHEYLDDLDFIKIGTNTSPYSLRPTFKVGSGTFTTGSTPLFYSGSTNAETWNNLLSTINSNPNSNYSANYSIVQYNSLTGLTFRETSTNYGSIASGSTLNNLVGSGGSMTFTSWIYVEDAWANNGQKGYFFAAKDDGEVLNPTTFNFRITTPSWPTSYMTFGCFNDAVNSSFWRWDNPFTNQIYRNEWVNLTLIYNGGGSSGDAKLFVNNVEQMEIGHGSGGASLRASTDGSSKVAWFNSITASIGAGSYADQLRNIAIDEFGWFDKELSTTEIETVYNNGVPLNLTASSISNLMHYWNVSSSGDYLNTGVDFHLQDKALNSGDISGSINESGVGNISFAEEQDESSAVFSITASIQGAEYDGFEKSGGSNPVGIYIINPLSGGSSGTPEIYSNTIENKFDNFNVSRAIPATDYNYSWVTSSFGRREAFGQGTHATAKINISTNPTAGDTLTFGDGIKAPTTYTFANPAPDADQILIGFSTSATRTNIINKITSDGYNVSFNGTPASITNLNIGALGNYLLQASFTSGFNFVEGFSNGEDGQLVYGYWPKDGILSASANVSWRGNGFDSAVNFPTGSEILGS